MSRYWFALVPFLAACLAYAQDDGAAIPPSETVSVIWVAVFGVLFVGMIVGFFVYLWWNEKKNKNKGNED